MTTLPNPFFMPIYTVVVKQATTASANYNKMIGKIAASRPVDVRRTGGP
jgi:hypothetical protein